MSDAIDELFNRPPNVCERAYALWILMRDFRAECKALPSGELSRRCEDIVAAMDIVEERIASRQADPDEVGS